MIHFAKIVTYLCCAIIRLNKAFHFIFRIHLSLIKLIIILLWTILANLEIDYKRTDLHVQDLVMDFLLIYIIYLPLELWMKFLSYFFSFRYNHRKIISMDQLDFEIFFKQMMWKCYSQWIYTQRNPLWSYPNHLKNLEL